MRNPVNAIPKKSTNVRSFSQRWQRLLFRTLEAVAPDVAARRAADLFFTPRRRGVTRSLSPAGLRPAAAFEVRIAESDLRLPAWSWGAGPAVLLVHGWEGDAGQLMPLVPPLVAAGLRPVAFDLPAHGAAGGTTTTILEMAAAIRAVAAAVGPVRGVIAHSLGGAAAALAVSAAGSDVVAAAVPGVAAAVAAERVVLLAPAAEPTHYARVLAQLAGLSPAGTDAMLAAVAARLGLPLDRVDVTRYVGALAAACLVLHDPADREVPWAHGKAIAQAWPGAELVPLDGRGHRRILRDPHMIARVVEFLRARSVDARAPELADAN
jgi:Alpha/beta hydrolase family